MGTRKRFPDLEMLARERGYTLSRSGRTVFWSRNGDSGRIYSSSGVSSAWEDILLDASSKEQAPAGNASTTPGAYT
jgi:hypothetical protein